MDVPGGKERDQEVVTVGSETDYSFMGVATCLVSRRGIDHPGGREVVGRIDKRRVDGKQKDLESRLS